MNFNKYFINLIELMRKFFNLIIVTLVATVGVVCVSCEKEEETFEAGSIIGIWHQTNSYGTEITLVFNKDTSGSISFYYTNGDSSTERFSYDYDVSSRELSILEETCSLCGDYAVSVSAKRLELRGYNYYSGENGWYVFTR